MGAWWLGLSFPDNPSTLCDGVRGVVGPGRHVLSAHFLRLLLLGCVLFIDFRFVAIFYVSRIFPRFPPSRSFLVVRS